MENRRQGDEPFRSLPVEWTMRRHGRCWRRQSLLIPAFSSLPDGATENRDLSCKQAIEQAMVSFPREERLWMSGGYDLNLPPTFIGNMI